ncbi:MAG: FHA domain-containing protein, partial [Candidatus Omnitrophota bacterium]
MKRYGFIQKLGALTVAIVFSFTTVVSAAPVCYSLKIPEEEGRVTQRYKGEGEKTIIHIQDAHSNLEAQYNLAKIIQYLAAQGSVNDRSGFIADKNADNCADVQEDVNRLRASASTSDQTVQDALDEQNLRNQQARMPVIGIEGAIGHVDVTPFREFPLEEVREKVAKTYVKEGIFTGSELAAVASRDEIALWGIEDRKLFEEDFRAFYNVARRQGELTLEVERIEGYLDLLKTPIFNEKLKQFDRAASEYEHNQAQLMRFLGTLYSAIDEVEIDLIDYIQLLQFKEAFVLERMITFDSVDTEIQQLAEVLTAHYKDTDGSRVEEIKTRYKQYLKNKSNRKGIASYLNALAVKEGMDQRRYPHLSKAIIYWRKYATVDIGQMMREVLGVSHEVRLKFAQNENEELLINTGEKIMRLKQLLALKALKEDVAAFRMVQDSFSINDIIHDIKRLALSASLTLDIAPPRIDIDEILMMVDAFYTLAEQRDEAMLANLIKKMDEENKTVGVLVAGGYHSQGIVDLLKKNTISYVNIMPAIDSVTNDVAYMDRMMGNIAPLSPHLTSHLNSSQLNGILSTLSPGFIQQIIERYGDDTIRETTDNVALAAQLVLENKDKDLARIIYGYAKKLAQQEIEKGEKEGLDWNQIVENIKSSDTCVKYGNTITTLLEPKGPSVGTTGLNIGTDGSQEGHDEAVRKIRNAIYAIAVRQAERRVTTGEWNQSRLQRELQVINKIFMNVEIDIEEDKEDTDEHYVFYEKYGGEEFLVIVIDGLDDEGFVKGKDQHGHVGLSRKQIYLTRKAYNEYAAARNKTESDPDLWEQAGLHNALRHEIVEFMAWRQWAEQEGAKEEYEYTPEMAYLNARQMAKDLQIRTGVNKAKDIHNFAQRKAPVTADSEFADDGIVAEEEKSLDRIIITISGRTIVLPRGESVTIGSSERYADPRLKNSFYFNFMGISRKHAMISYRDNGDITIENYSSDTQGVLIDGKAIGENKSIPISIEGETKNSVQFFGALNLDISREIPVKTENIVIGGEAYVVSEKTPLFIGINPDTKEIGIAQQREMQHGETKLKSCAKVSLKQDTEGGKEGEFKVSIDYFPGTNVNGGTIQNEKDGEGSTWDPKGFVSLNNRPLAYQIGAVIGAQAFNAERMAGQEARNLTRQGMRRQAVGELSVAEYSWIIQMKLARIERAIKNAKESKDKETQVALSKQHLEFNQLLKNVENPEYVLTEQDFAMLKLTDGPEVVRAEDPKMIKRIASQIVETKVQEEVVNFIKRDNRGIRVVIVDNIEFLIRDTSQTIYSDINDSRIYITRSAYDASMQEKGASNALSRAICKLVLSQKLAFDKGIQYSLLPLYMTEQEEQTIDERVESAFEIPVQEEGKILQENINRLRFPDQELTRLLEEKRDGKGLVRMLDMGEMG